MLLASITTGMAGDGSASSPVRMALVPVNLRNRTMAMTLTPLRVAPLQMPSKATRASTTRYFPGHTLDVSQLGNTLESGVSLTASSSGRDALQPGVGYQGLSS